MKLKAILVILVLTTLSFAQTATPNASTPAPASSEQKAAEGCCHHMAKDGAGCCSHQDADKSAMACCKGDKGKACMKAGKDAAGCADGKCCGKDHAKGCCAKSGDQTAMACCKSGKCGMADHDDHHAAMNQ